MTSQQLASGFQQMQQWLRTLRMVLGNDLLGYTVKRLLQGVLTLFLASILTFYIVDLAPGDYLDAFKNNPQMSQQRLEELRQQFGLDKTWQDSGLAASFKTSATPVTALAISPDGETLVVGNPDKAVRLWKKDGSLTKTFQGHQGPITALALSPEGQLIASGSQDQTLRIWKKDGTLAKTLQDHQGAITALAFSPDGQLIASGSQDQTVRLWQTDGKLLQTLKGHQGPISAIALSPDGKTLASGSADQTVRIWQTDGKALQTLKLQGTVTALQFAKAEAATIHLYSVTEDQTLTEWSLAGKQLRQQSLAQLSGQATPITKVIFSPDGETFATLSQNNRAQLWQLEDGASLTAVAGKQAPLLGVAFGNNGSELALVSGDQSVQFWQKDRSLIKQYWAWLTQVLRGDFGESFTYQRPVTVLIWERVPNTLLLAIASLVINWGVAIPLGIIGAVNQNGWSDRILRVISYIGQGFPSFVSALLLLFLAQSTPFFPVGNMTSIDHADLSWLGKTLDVLWHMILPTIALSITGFAGLQRITRGNLLDVLRQNYIQTARAKGLPESRVIYLHALRNAVNPLITLLGFEFSSLLGGAFIAEFFFNWPGLGQLLLKAVQSQDLYLVMAGLMMGAVMLIIGNLLADILLAVVDPRIKLDKMN